MYETGSSLGWLYDQLTGDEDTRVCKDIPDDACRHQPRNFFAYLGANLLGKIADELSSARLVLPWLLSALGAPAVFTGFLVPIREAGVLLPQLVVAAYVRHLARRKGVWLLGALISAAAMALMAVTATTLSGVAAGWGIVGLLAAFSLARGLCSVSAKDVLGKTVSKTRRGALMGYSAGLAGAATLGIGLYLEARAGAATPQSLFLIFLAAAAMLWLVATAVFALIREAPGATEGGGNALGAALRSLGLLKSDAVFRRYVINRILLLNIALAPPFYVMIAQQHAQGASGLGMLIIASGLASSLSAPLLGKLGDRSSRMVIAGGAAAAAATGFATWLLAVREAPLMNEPLSYAVLFLLIAVSHSSVRLGRKVYLVDMASTDNRSAYVAVSNTVIGVVMLAGGLVGILGDLLGSSYVILFLAVGSLAAGLHALRLPEVSG
jgi:hypothetical protein